MQRRGCRRDGIDLDAAHLEPPAHDGALHLQRLRLEHERLQEEDARQQRACRRWRQRAPRRPRRLEVAHAGEEHTPLHHVVGDQGTQRWRERGAIQVFLQKILLFVGYARDFEVYAPLLLRFGGHVRASP